MPKKYKMWSDLINETIFTNGLNIAIFLFHHYAAPQWPTSAWLIQPCFSLCCYMYYTSSSDLCNLFWTLPWMTFISVLRALQSSKLSIVPMIVYHYIAIVKLTCKDILATVGLHFTYWLVYLLYVDYNFTESLSWLLCVQSTKHKRAIHKCIEIILLSLHRTQNRLKIVLHVLATFNVYIVADRLI